MNVLGICRLKWSQIDHNVLTYSREKTKNTKRIVEPIIVPLKKETWEIIKKWGNDNKNPADYIFPFFNELDSQSMKARRRKKDINKKNKYGIKKNQNGSRYQNPLNYLCGQAYLCHNNDSK